MECWDQRIPNRPIFERNFLFDTPAIAVMGRPTTTYQRMNGDKRCRLVLSREGERNIANWWYQNIYNKRGLSTHRMYNHTLKTLLAKFPDRPWLKSNRRVVSDESYVKGIHRKADKDCIHTTPKAPDMQTLIPDANLSGRNLYGINTSAKFLN